ncbi:MAG: hypothetical protein EOP54_11790, partial [Sphingobacteriales bacterium]
MGLSSNTVIHFTNNLSNLKGRIKDKFQIRYCRETITGKQKVYDLLIPMVSFCDIPFSQIVNHIDSYGSYGIGLKKTWAEQNGLNPVLYLDRNSQLTENILEKLYSHLVSNKKTLSELDDDEKCHFDFIRYIKNYQGNLQRINKKAIQNYRFSDEREWRYVIDPKSKNPLFGNLKNASKEDITDGKKKMNEKIKDIRLEFIPDDINYIIIKNE